MSLLSKETKALQKKFQDSYVKDIKALVGKCFIDSEAEDDEDEVCDTRALKQYMMITGLGEGELIGTAITFDHGRLLSLEANTFVEFLSDSPMQCSPKEFAAAMERGLREFEKNVGDLKKELEDDKPEEKK